ncbi:MAG: potassium-transporting ATPase subunit KdpA, partial [Ruthenibacterium sp.]
NGGGYNGANSASSLENPTPFTNLVQCLSLLLLPVALVFSFGRYVADKKQGRALFATMFILFLVALLAVAFFEQAGTPQLAQGGAVYMGQSGQSGGNMEGKETRFGVADSALWATSTTAASNGSVNSMLDSFTPIGGMVPLILMQLGEVIFGGVGSGLYAMLGFVILTVFIAGLMVGRTP